MLNIIQAQQAGKADPKSLHASPSQVTIWPFLQVAFCSTIHAVLLALKPGNGFICKPQIGGPFVLPSPENFLRQRIVSPELDKRTVGPLMQWLGPFQMELWTPAPSGICYIFAYLFHKRPYFFIIQGLWRDLQQFQ